MNVAGWKLAWLVVATTTACLTLTLSAQVKTQTTTATGQPNVVTKVERGEVVTVSGNDLVVKMADGTIRHFANVPQSARVTVDGKQLGIHDLKPGMKLQRTITTTTTPMTITTVQTVKGTVWAIQPPLSVILTLEDGKNQQFKIPKDQKFDVDGQMVDAWGVRKGMIITATKIVEEPAVEVTQTKTVTGEAPPMPIAAGVPVLVAEGSEEAVPTPAQAPVAAPEATSGMSTTRLIGFLCLLVVVAGVGWYVLRKSRSRA
jgi:hypothetical protein